ncbi:MAG: chemotaxis protein CheW [Deltaproteobacteria bacterium]|nr:chemotaxis protein CheW [Deltaproteobacteria bacterium]
MVQQTILTERGVADGQEDRHLRGNIDALGEVIDSLQARLRELRMVPVKTMFSRMGRLVREVAQKTGKKIDLQLEGEETEVDRQLIDEINDPLVHLLRNAVDHGVETPTERQAAGKEARGTIRLQARRQGDQLLIIIQDDGRGLDREAIFQKGLERGLLDQRREYSDEDVFQMILHPGFSTAKAVSEISGRGVGMDVVTKAIRRLKGELEITSQPGEGSTFTIRSPLDLAIAEGITDGIVVRVGCENYVIPVNSMVEAVYPKKKEITRLGPGDEIVRLRGENYSLIRLHRLFGVKPEKEDPWEAAVVIAEAEDKRLALMVDEIVHQQRAVVRGLNKTVFPCRTVSGLALMGDEAGLMMDINGIAENLFGSSLSA